MLLYQWRNDEDVRKNAFHSEPLVYGNHLRWLNKILCSRSSIYFFILMDGDTAIGQIRADEQERESYLITYSIGREHRSSGYGIQIIHLLEVEMMKKNKSVKVKACVKKDNIASQKIFEYNGYRRQNMQEFFVYEKNLRSR